MTGGDQKLVVKGGCEEQFGVRLNLVGEEGGNLAVWADHGEGIGGRFDPAVLIQGDIDSL